MYSFPEKQSRSCINKVIVFLKYNIFISRESGSKIILALVHNADAPPTFVKITWVIFIKGPLTPFKFNAQQDHGGSKKFSITG